MSDTYCTREAKLPQWARALLAVERRRADEAERKLAAHLETVEKTRIWYGTYDNPIYVPGDGYQTIHLDVGGRGFWQEQFQIRLKDGGIEIQGGRSVVVEPVVSNTLLIRHCER